MKLIKKLLNYLLFWNPFRKKSLSPNKLKNDFFSNFQTSKKNLEACNKSVNIKYFNHIDHKNIRGWLTPTERQLLYSMAYVLDGPILELGSWVGLSTTAIAQAIKDCKSIKNLYAVEYSPTLNNFKKMENGQIGFYLPGDTIPRGICSKELYETDILPVLELKGGIKEALKKNLSAKNLLGLVHTEFCTFDEFESELKFNLIFCDALHDINEINENYKVIDKYLLEEGILICHDVGSDQTLIDHLHSKINLNKGVILDSMYITSKKK